MSIRVALHHRTEYRYDRLVGLSPHIIRLRPAPHCRTAVQSYSLKVTPADHFINWQQDPFGNYMARFVFPNPADRLCIEVDLVADLVVINPFDFFLEEGTTHFPFTYGEPYAEELKPYLAAAPVGPQLKAYLAGIPRARKHNIDFLVELNQKLSREIRYLIRLEPGVQTPEETLALGSGSCRDSAWLLVQILRNLGLAARFVSGYLIQLTADVKAVDGPAGPEDDFTDLHAWTEVYLPGAGWVGLDPTSGLFAGEGHLPLAGTPDPSSAAPVVGATDKAEVEFDFHMSVQRILEVPRISKPFPEEAWQAIDRLGARVDAALNAMDVRLTHGGEPTFVSDTDRESPEWHTEALGPEKWAKSLELFHRLSNHFAPFGLHLHGQGKWYPGESLPRWSLECFWRRDGLPLWRNPNLRGNARLNYGHGHPEAKRFIETLAQIIAVDPRFAIPAYEDVFYYLWRERRLPGNVDPFDSRLDDPEERARLMKVFQQGLDKLVGYALPLRAAWSGSHWFWESGAWFLRAERMYLIPGDSPMGLRLPLDSLPWEPAAQRQSALPIDPSAFPPGAHAAPFAQITHQLMRSAPVGLPPAGAHAGGFWGGEAGDGAGSPPIPGAGFYAPGGEAPAWIVRTALCVEPREGRLYVFMPPAHTAEHYFNLIGAVEQAALETGLPVIIEGYKPPHDPRILNFNIRPDPGVVEVNIHPASSWAELRDINEVLYEHARLTRLSAEKYAIDGRATGTGGGGHVVLGGPTAQDSPFLRNPALLSGLIAFFHNHPGLSYLFTGLFVGPTSQAPRVDEARNDMVPELEVAFRQAAAQMNTPPWLVDRLFRNLLVDVTGNTHRAELCIDKLFSPDSAEGRRGLVEMRAFEMPPHPRMALAQNLLVRALLAHLWQSPYTQRLVRWHTGLHDRYMLPHFVWDDFLDVLDQLRGAGFDFDPAWFDAQHEFRFPRFGEITVDGIHLELRAAIEPWHVLGEQPGGGGTARYVDSSVDRVQVLVRGLVESRHVIACNGYAVPLHPTGTVGEFVAAVRFRAWQPPECLHPTMPPHTPLIFDIIDTWNRRAIGGCTLYAAHPGGRNYETFPVNANEAEARRINRFAPIGHTPGPVTAAIPKSTPEHPLCLDLRLQA